MRLSTLIGLLVLVGLSGGCGNSTLWGPRITNGIPGAVFRDFTISGGNPVAVRLTLTGQAVTKIGFNQTAAVDPGYIHGGQTRFTVQHSIVDVSTGEIVGYGEYDISISKYRSGPRSGLYGSPENDISFLVTTDGVRSSNSYSGHGNGRLVPVKPLSAWAKLFREPVQTKNPSGSPTSGRGTDPFQSPMHSGAPGAPQEIIRTPEGGTRVRY